MIFKIAMIFDRITMKSEGKIMDKQQLDHLIQKMIERRTVVEHDVKLLNKFIVDFPFSFEQFCSYIRQIYLLEIENKMENKLIKIENVYENIFKFLSFYQFDRLNSDDLNIIFKNLNLNIDNLDKSIQECNKVNFLLRSIRDDSKHFLWEVINANIEKQTEKENPDFFILDSSDYQFKMNNRIEYEYEIIRTKRFQSNTDKIKFIKKYKKIIIERVYCADRDIPIISWKIPNSYFDKEIMSKFYSKCEALRELLLSKHFQKFAGFDDISFDDCQYYFFEHLEGLPLLQFLGQLDIDLGESSLVFRYFAKEILCSFRDLLYKSNYSFSLPINENNLFYEPSQLRLYLDNLEFGTHRKTILESHDIVESKLLYFYGIILLKLLALTKPEIQGLIDEISSVCSDLNEFEQMQKIFEILPYIEETLTKILENDYIITIVVECLISPYKSKIVFDNYYNKKNFLEEALKSKVMDVDFQEMKRRNKIETFPYRDSKKCLRIDNDNKDKFITSEPYFFKNSKDENLPITEEEKNENYLTKMINMKLLLIHPFYSDIKLDKSFLNFLFKDK